MPKRNQTQPSNAGDLRQFAAGSRSFKVTPRFSLQIADVRLSENYDRIHRRVFADSKCILDINRLRLKLVVFAMIVVKILPVVNVAEQEESVQLMQCGATYDFR